MKYFMGRPRNIRPDIQAVIFDMVCELEANRAKEIYMIWGEHNGYAGDSLEQLPLAYWKQGKLCALRNYDVWGEDINDNELFKRRLNGTLAKEVVK